jgi:GDPmannose 4,6-dehydratase
VNPEFFRPAEVELLIGDYTKAKTELGWQPKTKYNELAALMLKSDIERNK